MSPDEVGLFLDYNRPVKMFGSMSEDDVDELIEMRGNGEGFI